MAFGQASSEESVSWRLCVTELVDGAKPILRLLVERSERYGKESKI
jgi:hypothetical protein